MGEGNSLVTTLPNWRTEISVKLCVGAFHSETKTLLTKVNPVNYFSCSAAIWKDEDVLLYTHKPPDTNTASVPGGHQRSCPQDPVTKAGDQVTPSHASPNLLLIDPRSWGQHALGCFRFCATALVQLSSCLEISQSNSVSLYSILNFQIIPDLCC